jgi:glycosyltransferase involved in cell wall biosynthesis
METIPRGGRGKQVLILIPAYNEADSIGEILTRLHQQLSALPYRFSVLVVDDGSTDDTATVALARGHLLPTTVLKLSRNFGKETALLAGFDHAEAEAVIVMDADLQHPLELIPKFLELWESGYQMVYGVKQNRKSESRLKAFTVNLFYKAINSRSDFYIQPNATDFRLLDRSVIAALVSLRERVRFTKGLYAWAGFRSIGIEFVPPQRMAGSSHFSSRALRRLGLDGLTSFSDAPLRLSADLGICIALASIAYGAYIAVRTLFFGIDVPGWATLTVAVTLLGGLQLFFIGVVGTYVRNIFEETKQRPNYIVADIIKPKAASRVKPGTSALSRAL